MPRKLLLHSLRLQLKHPLKRKKERHFIVERLQLLDQQFYLDHIRCLYQTYFDQGLKFHMWPDGILKIAQITERTVIQKYLEEYLILLRDKISQCTTELATQSSPCPLTLSLLNIVDVRLHEFVRLHHIDLMRTIRFRINKLKDKIHEKQLFQHLSYYYLNNDQFKAISRLTTIRKEQLKVFDEQTMLEQQILCHQLPESLDSILPNLDMKKLSQKHCKMVQELKRFTLNLELQRYEEDIHRYEQLYQEEFNKLQEQIQNPTSSDYKHQIDILMYSVESYLNNYKHRLLRQIRHREACFHTNLIRQRRRRQSFMRENNIQVHPQIIVDVPKVALNDGQLQFLSQNGPSYIRPNQSYLHCDQQQQKQIDREFNKTLDVIVPYLVRVYHMSPTSTIISRFSHQLATYLCEQYMAPVSYLHAHRARQERKLIQSIRYRLKKSNQVLRVTDKSGIFHIGDANDYEQKAEAYREKTKAYIELENDPLCVVFDKAVNLLNDLRSKKHILAWQFDKMIPKRENAQLAYLYFVPKPHKEGTPLRPIVSSMHMPTTGISKFLDRLLRPLFDKHVRSTTIIDGVDLIRRLQAYTANGYLKPTTYFCTFDITDLYTMLPQEESLDILTEFLLEHGYTKVNAVPIFVQISRLRSFL
ncbi:unnamed protein product [Adineta ricciae]|uniref:Reverse transcriptase domain-containing protein n=2 Tax=Adineta ricciae TaxID=249248 RepID=A0A815VG40_ADIRI|nr:unnamed protein product [Adineta ricciae]